LIQQIYGYSAQWLLYEEGNALKKIIHRTLKTRPQMVSILNTFTREEMEMVMDHIEYIIKETVTNITGELSNYKKVLKYLTLFLYNILVLVYSKG
jgi:hypothetical protein